MAVCLFFSFKGLGREKLPSPSPTLVIEDRRNPCWSYPPPPQWGRGAQGIWRSAAGRAGGHPGASILVKVALSGLGERQVAKRAAGGERVEKRQEKGEGDLSLLGAERWGFPPPGEAGAVSQEEGASCHWP